MNSVLVTPPLLIETANSAQYGVYCNVLNVSSSPRTGTLEIVTFSGVTVNFGGYGNVVPGGGTGIRMESFENVFPVIFLYCRISVDGEHDSIRANLVLADANGNTLVSLEAH
jgi:hypothetical protein